MLIYVFEAIFEYLSGRLVSHFGAKHIIALSLPLMALSFVFLLSLDVYHWPLWFLALTNAIPLSFFWLPYHDDLSKAKHRKSIGKEMGMLQILINTSSALGPLIGGVVAYRFGIQYTFVLATVAMFVAMIPLFRSPEIVKRRPLEMKNFNVMKNMKDMVAYGGLGLENISSTIVWPLILFLILSNYEKIGFIATVALFASILVSIFMGKLTDKYNKRKVLKVSSLIHSFSVSTRFLATTINAAYLINIVSSVTHVVMFVPFVSEFYSRADEEPRTEYILGMEIAVDVARAVGFAILMFATYFLSFIGVLYLGILLGVIGAFLTMFITSPIRKEKTIKLQSEIARARI